MFDLTLFLVVLASLLIGSGVTQFRNRRKFQRQWALNWDHEIWRRSQILEEKLVSISLIETGLLPADDKQSIEYQVVACMAVIEQAYKMRGLDEQHFDRQIEAVSKSAQEKAVNIAARAIRERP